MTQPPNPPTPGTPPAAPAPAPPTPTPGAPADSGTDATFSQADVDRIVSDRLARQKSQYANYDDYKKKALEFDKATEAAKTEHEKAVEAARKEGHGDAISKANARLVAAEARAVAAAAKFRNPAIAPSLLDLSSVKVADDGTVDEAAVKALVEDLAKREPYLVDDGKGPRPSGDIGQGPRPTPPPSNPRQADLAQIEADIKAGARRTG